MMINGTPLYYESVGELSRRIHEQTVSPVEVVEACLKRIERLNPTLNAFITVLADDARAQARAAEAEIKAGRGRGPLHGLPVAVKDFYDTAGVMTTAGAEQFKSRVPTTDAEVVKKLRHAGAIVIGKTNMDALGMATGGPANKACIHGWSPRNESPTWATEALARRPGSPPLLELPPTEHSELRWVTP